MIDWFSMQNGEPCRVGVAVVDLHTGLYAKGAILAALIHRYRTNRGQHVKCNLLNTCVSFLQVALMQFTWSS